MLINPQEFVSDIPDLHPLSNDYVDYWRETNKKIIEGTWLGGYYMPSGLHFYSNLGTILLNEPNSNTKTLSRPNLRDLEWYLQRAWTECLGFSGFEDDEEYSGNFLLLDPLYTDERLKARVPSVFNSKGEKKEFRKPRDLLESRHPYHKGRALFENQAYNMFMMGCYTKDHKVRMYDGSTKTVLSLKIGDQLLGIDSIPRVVTSIIRSQKKAPAYKITQTRGDDYTVTEDHELELMVLNSDGTRTRKKVKAKDLYKESLRLKTFSNKYKGFRRAAVVEGTDISQLHPYYLGLWLGDGDSRDQTVTSSDPEIWSYMETLATELGGSLSKYDNKEPIKGRKQTYRLYAKNTPLRDILRSLNMLDNKHIPTEILTASFKDRMDFLAGLIDSDGNKSAGQYSIYQKTKIEGLEDLIMSLGFTITNSYKRDRVTRKGKMTSEYRVTFTGNGITNIPVKITRKKLDTEPKKDFSLTTIKIEPAQEDYFFGITVDQDHSYCHSDYTLTGNSRDTGKSYWVSQAVVLHKWLTNGATKVGQKIANPVDITVGAAMSSYSNLLLGKTRYALENLPGAKIVNGKLYPAPLFQHYVGSWVPGKDIVAAYDKKYPGGWQREGSKSIIRHRSFKDNSFADQGSRALAIVLEEVGMFPNLMDVYSDTKDNLRDGLRKIGSLVMLGTGGNMESGTIDASTMFYEPEAYEILPFEDIWENNGSIGLFIPAYMALNEFKDDRGFSDIEAATKALKDARDKIKYGSGGSSALNKEMQYRPIVPSEMFLTKSSNIFPVPELRRRLSELQTGGIYELLEKKVELYFDPSSPFNGVNYRIDPNLMAINTWPWKEDSTEGAIVIYELPHMIDGSVPRDAYIISCDPFRDNTAAGESFAAIYVMKTSKYPTTVGHNEIVATYVGRPYLGVNAVNEILHKLSLFYGNATIYFENAVGNVKDYFEKINRLDLLASQPVNVLNKKASFNTRESVIYGYPMSNEKIKWEALQYYRSWLLEEREAGKRNLDLIPDKFLIQQTIAFTMKGNFDGVMGVLGCIIGLQEIYVASKKREEVQSSRSKLDEDITQLIKHNKRLFINEQLSKTEALLFGENQRQL